MDTNAANSFTASERLIQEHVKKYKNGSAELKDVIQPWQVAEVDHGVHERLMTAIEAGDIEVIDLWKEGGCNQDVRSYKKPALKVC